MLLLVLILVLIAFGLLLVGFLSASVLWAWVSVAVSVGAAGVLLFDTLQRRSVVRAGDDAGREAPVDDVAVERTTSVADPGQPALGSAGGRGDLDPATEIIPVVRPTAYQGQGVDPRFDPDADSQQTVMLPAVQPSGSPAGPSGAAWGQTPSSESSSPSVTFSKDQPRVPNGPGVGDQSTVVVRVADPDVPSDLAVTTATPIPPDGPGPADGPSEPGAREPADEGPAVSGGAAGIGGTAGIGGAAAIGGAAGLAGAAGSAAVSRPTDVPSADPGGPTDAGDVEATTAVAPPSREERGATSAAPPAEAPGSLFASGPGTNGTSQQAAPEPVAAAGPPPPSASEPVVEPPAGGSATGTPAVGTPSVGAPSVGAPAVGTSGELPPSGPAAADVHAAADVPAADAPATDVPAADAPAADVPAADVPAADVPAADVPAADVPEVDVPEVDGEAPEERSDPQVAALVAGLEDEVLVIDEHPRYHVTGCRALAAVALIPLPVREAVELGFTPCGWCSPDHALASRHRATAR